MKKILAMVLVALLIMSTSMFALAANPAPSGSITFKKHYDSSDGKTFPAETLHFTVEADTGNPDGGIASLTIGKEQDYQVTGIDNEITATYPDLPNAGLYYFTIKEVKGSTQGVEYTPEGTTQEIVVAILVTYDDDGNLEVTEGHAGVKKDDPDAEKEDTFTNKYKLGNKGPGSLTVQKTTEGNLADPMKYFTIKVTFEAEGAVLSTIEYSGGSDDTAEGTIAPEDWEDGKAEVTIKLKNTETVSFDKIPEGVTYTVEEDGNHLAADQEGGPTLEELNGEEGYIVSYTDEEGEIVEDESKDAKVNNKKEKEILTGVILQYAPYIAILAVVLAGVALMIIRRRRHNDD